MGGEAAVGGALGLHDGRGNMNLEELRAYITKQTWVFAKTYADRTPHEYIVRHKCAGEDAEFMAMAEYIAENGITMYFWDHPNKYIFVDGRQYWVMKDSNDDPSIVINRANLEEYKLSITWKGEERSNADS